jgi:hypothetical protein
VAQTILNKLFCYFMFSGGIVGTSKIIKCVYLLGYDIGNNSKKSK